jgi:hypothetical protein
MRGGIAEALEVHQVLARGMVHRKPINPHITYQRPLLRARSCLFMEGSLGRTRFFLLFLPTLRRRPVRAFLPCRYQ